MNVNVILHSLSASLAKRGIEDKGRVQKYIDSEVLRRCEPLVPKDSGTLLRSAQMATRLGTGLVIYNTPYAGLVYRRPAKYRGAPQRGNFWFERMKSNGGKEEILEGARQLAGGMK